MYSVDALRWKGIQAGSDCPRRGCGALSRRQRIADPYDGLIPGQESLKVHACVVCHCLPGKT